MRALRDAVAALAALAAAAPAGAQEAAPRTAMVTFADGSTLPLRAWSLAYDYLTWPVGGTQLNATTHNKPAVEIWVGKRAFPAAGLKLAVTFRDLRREVLVDGRPQDVVAQIPVELSLTTADGKTSKVKVAPPERDLLAPGLDKKTLLLARSLDLSGETVTGGKRTLCLLSFSTLVDCGSSPSDVVAKVEFSR
jgi:hypothetical protein